MWNSFSWFRRLHHKSKLIDWQKKQYRIKFNIKVSLAFGLAVMAIACFTGHVSGGNKVFTKLQEKWGVLYRKSESSSFCWTIGRGRIVSHQMSSLYCCSNFGIHSRKVISQNNSHFTLHIRCCHLVPCITARHSTWCQWYQPKHNSFWRVHHGDVVDHAAGVGGVLHCSGQG